MYLTGSFANDTNDMPACDLAEGSFSCIVSSIAVTWSLDDVGLWVGIH